MILHAQNGTNWLRPFLTLSYIKRDKYTYLKLFNSKHVSEIYNSVPWLDLTELISMYTTRCVKIIIFSSIWLPEYHLISKIMIYYL